VDVNPLLPGFPRGGFQFGDQCVHVLLEIRQQPEGINPHGGKEMPHACRGWVGWVCHRLAESAASQHARENIHQQRQPIALVPAHHVHAAERH